MRKGRPWIERGYYTGVMVADAAFPSKLSTSSKLCSAKDSTLAGITFVSQSNAAYVTMIVGDYTYSSGGTVRGFKLAAKSALKTYCSGAPDVAHGSPRCNSLAYPKPTLSSAGSSNQCTAQCDRGYKLTGVDFQCDPNTKKIFGQANCSATCSLSREGAKDMGLDDFDTDCDNILVGDTCSKVVCDDRDHKVSE